MSKWREIAKCSILVVCGVAIGLKGCWAIILAWLVLCSIVVVMEYDKG